MAHRHGAVFVADWRQHCHQLDRNERCRINFLAEALERRTKPAGRRNGVVGYVGLAVLRALLFGFLNHSTGLCCPSYDALQKVTGLCRQSIANGVARLEQAGIVKIVRRLCRQYVNRDGWSYLTTTQATSLYSLHRPGAWADHLPRQRAKHAPFPDRRQLSLIERMALTWKVHPSLGRREEPTPTINPIPRFQRVGDAR